MMIYCEEKPEPRIRVVRHFSPTPEKLRTIEERCAGLPTFFDERGVSGLLDPTWQIFEVDDVGLVMLDKLTPGENGRVHVTFWDKRLRGRELLCRRIAQYWCERFDLRFVWTSIPVDRRTVIAFCKRVGFEEIDLSEGVQHLLFARRK